MGKISLSYPDTGLTISISVKNRDTGVEDFSGTMTEVGTTREYKYDFTEVANTDYVYVATVAGYSDMSGVIYSDTGSSGGLTTEEHNKLFSLENSTGGGGFSINYQAINSHTTNKVNELKEELVKLPKIIEDGFNETNSHIDTLNTDISEKIELIETPESDTSEITLGIGILKQRFTKLSEYLRKESDNEKELIKKRTGTKNRRDRECLGRYSEAP